MEGIVPLNYEMSKAPAEIINSNSIIKSLKSAFRFGNIGKYSNKLTKIWNSETKDIETAKMLTALNNFYIDGAKTNYCPEVYSSVKEEITAFKTDKRKQFYQDVNKLKETQKDEKKQILSAIKDKELRILKREELNKIHKKNISDLKEKLTLENSSETENKKESILEKDMFHKIKISDKAKLPYFFRYAKDLETSKVEKINDSTVNKACRLVDEIPQLDFYFGKDKFNWHYLASNFKIDIENDNALSIIEEYEILNNQIKSYFAKAKDEEDSEEINKLTTATRVYSMVRSDFEKFIEELEVNIVEATDILVCYIYKNKRESKKAFLFDVLGDIILDNIKKNKLEANNVKSIECGLCGKIVEKKSNKTKYCMECSKKIAQEQKNNWKLKQKEKNRNHSQD